MTGNLKIVSSILAYGDTPATSNPMRRYVDWSICRTYQVSNPQALSYQVPANSSLTLFSGSRSTAIDNTTEFSLTLSTLAADRYRFTWDGTGTSPSLCTNRALTLSNVAVTMTVNTNATVTMSTGTSQFSAVQVGDTVFFPGVTTGDSASPFNTLNEGWWTVLSASATSLQLTRPAGATFSGATETVTPSANSQVLAYSESGVQVGDGIDINAGFSGAVINTYTVAAVTPTWFEVISTQALPTGVTAVPGATGIQFYTDAKRYLRVESDQNCVLRLNGDTGNTNRIAPWFPADPDNTGVYEKGGPVWSATVVNLSSAPLNLLVITAE